MKVNATIEETIHVAFSTISKVYDDGCSFRHPGLEIWDQHSQRSYTFSVSDLKLWPWKIAFKCTTCVVVIHLFGLQIRCRTRPDVLYEGNSNQGANSAIYCVPRFCILDLM